MKGAIYVLLPMVLIAVIALACYPAIGLIGRRRRAAAVRAARWERYSSPRSGGFAEVGVQLVARLGRNRKMILKSEEMVRVRVDDLSSTALADAQNEADLRASSYNLLR